MTLLPSELNLVRQWFNCIEDVNPAFLEARDKRLAARIAAYLSARKSAKG